VVVAAGVPLASLALAESAGDRAVAEQILANPPAASASADQAAVKTPLEEAKKALDRAAGARRSGDTRHAELLEGLAREWAETARDVMRANSVEANASAMEVGATDAGVRAERARTLLEESIARRGRAQAELDKLTADAGPIPVAPPSSSARSKAPKAPRAAPSASAAPAEAR
jgi:hypothetical protein